MAGFIIRPMSLPATAVASLLVTIKNSNSTHQMPSTTPQTTIKGQPLITTLTNHIISVSLKFHRTFHKIHLTLKNSLHLWHTLMTKSQLREKSNLLAAWHRLKVSISRRSAGHQSAKRKYLSALMQPTPTMRRGCALTAITQRAAPKWLTRVAIQTDSCMPMESARIVTLVSITRPRGSRRKLRNRDSRLKKLCSLAKSKERGNQKLKLVQHLSPTHSQIDHTKNDRWSLNEEMRDPAHLLDLCK